MKRWLWFTIGNRIWRMYARTEPTHEVQRLLGWMTLDNLENSCGMRTEELQRRGVLPK